MWPVVSLLLNHPRAYHAFDHPLSLEVLSLFWHCWHSLPQSSHTFLAIYIQLLVHAFKNVPMKYWSSPELFSIYLIVLGISFPSMIKTTNVLCSGLINILIDLKPSSLLFFILAYLTDRNLLIKFFFLPLWSIWVG